MDQPGTVFYLAAFQNNTHAAEVIYDPANEARRCFFPGVGEVLRIGLDQKHDTRILARFGRRNENDVVLGKRFPRNDQCYFDFNETTGELVLHDISEKKGTELYSIERNKLDKQIEEWGKPQMWKDHRQCAVILSPDPYEDPEEPRDRKWILSIHKVLFLLIPRRTEGQDEAVIRERLAFAAQADPEQTDEGTTARLVARGLQSLRSEAQMTAETLTTTYKSLSTVTAYDTRFRTPLEPCKGGETRYIKLRRLGKGGQGEVHEVADTYDGAHFACKIIEVEGWIPNRKIFSVKQFREKMEQEVKWVKQICSSVGSPFYHRPPQC